MTIPPIMARPRTLALALPAALAATVVLSQPADIIALGVVIGMLYALLSLGFVLVYKATRVLNMAHGDVGGFAAILLVSVVVNLRWNYWVALAVALVAGIAAGALMETMFVNKLRNAPRLVLLVATLGIGQLITMLNTLVISPNDQAQLLTRGRFPEPFAKQVTVFGATLRPSAVLTIVLVPLVTAALAAFMRYHRFGVAMRAAAENEGNARLLGVRVRRVSLVAWMISGGLSALAAVFIGGVSGTSLELGLGAGLLVRALAGAMLARLDSLPKAAAWGLAVGLVEQAALYQFRAVRAVSNTGLVDAALLVLILVALLAQRQQAGRAGQLAESSWPVADSMRTLGRAALEGVMNRRLRNAAFAAVLTAAVVVPFVLRSGHVFVMMQVIAFAVAGLSLVVLTGYGGQISLGQWAIAGIGGSVAARVDVALGWPAWATLLVAASVSAMTALVIGIPALRLRGLLLAVTTLAFAVAATGFVFGSEWFTGSQEGIRVDRPSLLHSDGAFYFASLGLFGLALLLARQAGRGRLGRAITAVRENERAAAATGVNLVAVKLATFGLSGAIAGIAGWIFVYAQGLTNLQAFLPAESINVVVLSVLGGIGSLAGPLLGSLAVVGLPRFLPDQAFLATLGTAVGVLQVLLRLPGGLVTLPIRLRDELVRDDEQPTTPEEGRPTPAPTPAPAAPLVEVTS